MTFLAENAYLFVVAMLVVVVASIHFAKRAKHKQQRDDTPDAPEEDRRTRDQLIEELDRLCRAMECIESEFPNTYQLNPEWQRLNLSALEVANKIEGRVARLV